MQQVIDGKTYHSDLIIFPDGRIQSSWWRKSGHRLSLEDIAHLVDASPYIFRAHFSMPSSLVDPEGRQAGATYGFASFLLKLFAQEKPSHLAVAFDSVVESFRDEVRAPAVGVSSKPRIESSVVLPLPDGPIKSVSSPGLRLIETPLRARTIAAPFSA